jgi:hypothetical protein
MPAPTAEDEATAVAGGSGPAGGDRPGTTGEGGDGSSAPGKVMRGGPAPEAPPKPPGKGSSCSPGRNSRSVA